MNRKHMIEATLAYLDTYASTWQSIAKIGEFKNALSAVNDEIDTAAGVQDQAAMSLGKVKLALKKSICTKADIINDIVEVFAQINGDDALAQKMSDSKSDLFKLKNEAMLIRVQMIITRCQENLDELVESYGLTDAQLLDLQSDVDRYLELDGKPRAYQIQRGVATRSIEELFSQANDILVNKLDNLLKIFKRRDPGFYDGYQRARMVVDY